MQKPECFTIFKRLKYLQLLHVLGLFLFMMNIMSWLPQFGHLTSPNKKLLFGGSKSII